MRKRLVPEDALWVIVLGHGHYDGRHSHLNIPGPDLDERAFGKLFDGIKAREQIFMIGTPASGFFLKPLAASGRIVITATEPDQEVNETVFPLALAEVLAVPPEGTDRDKDGKISVFELYLAVVANVMQRYVDAENLPTEHAKLDDNGDGHGSELQESYLPPELGGRAGQAASPRSAPRTMAPWLRGPTSRRRPSRERMSTPSFAPVCIALALAAQATDGKQHLADANADRLKFMKDSVQSYRLARSGDDAAVFKLQSDPVFRLGKQGDGVVLEGAIFLWADEVDRPAAAAQVFLVQSAAHSAGEWRHEFTSLSTRSFTATQAGKPRWMPMVAGVAFQPIPGAPKPADTPKERLRQMRELAGEFRAEDDFWGRGWSILRLLPRPISRYGKVAATPEDGALFAFVLGTDPEAFLFIEARKGNGGLEWQYAFAPMTCWRSGPSTRGDPSGASVERSTGNRSNLLQSHLRAMKPAELFQTTGHALRSTRCDQTA